MSKLEEFKEKYPDICKVILEEGMDLGRTTGFEEGEKAGLEKGIAEGANEGAEKERHRIMEVEAQSIPGHEALIQTLKFDGVTTGPEAAVKILADERKLRENVLSDINTDAPPLVLQPAHDEVPAAESDTDDMPVEERCKADWEKSSKLRAEFDDDYETYLAAEKALSGGYAKVIGRKEG